jgi:ATP-dependent RNA helicase DeaD
MPRPPETPPSGFAALGLAPEIVASVTALGYEEPTPVQVETIPMMLSGRDLLAQAATGTGKTAAFALPMLQRIAGSDTGPSTELRASRRTAGLVLVPTRELAMQVAEAVHKYARGGRLSVVPLFGGASMQQQIRSLERGASVVVATPGRALDHLRRKTLVLDKLQVLILDEADEMLDMGFAEDLDAILEATPEGTADGALFGDDAGADHVDRAAAPKNARGSPIAGEKLAAGKLPRVRQVAYYRRARHKAAASSACSRSRTRPRRSSSAAPASRSTRLVEMLKRTATAPRRCTAGMEQRLARPRHVALPRRQSDLPRSRPTSRRAGWTSSGISHVINYDVPADSESYVHRIGRTGRAGREGTAITLVEPREHRLLRSMEAVTKQKVEVATLPTVADLRARAPRSDARVAARAAAGRRPGSRARRGRDAGPGVRHHRRRGRGRADGALGARR